MNLRVPLRAASPFTNCGLCVYGVVCGVWCVVWCVCGVVWLTIGLEVAATPQVYNCYIMKSAAQARVILFTFPLRCSYWSGTSTSLFSPPMAQSYRPPNILNTFLPHSLRHKTIDVARLTDMSTTQPTATKCKN